MDESVKAESSAFTTLGNVLNRLVLPVLSRCSVCKLPKGKRHLVSGHDWMRDGSVPEWRGWHAFRRGVATNLQHLGATVSTAQGALRHSDASVTLKHYTKVVREDVRLMMEKLGDAVSDSQRTLNRTSGALPESIN